MLINYEFLVLSDENNLRASRNNRKKSEEFEQNNADHHQYLVCQEMT